MRCALVSSPMMSVSKSSITMTLSGLAMLFTLQVLPCASAGCTVPQTIGAMSVAEYVASTLR